MLLGVGKSSGSCPFEKDGFGDICPFQKDRFSDLISPRTSLRNRSTSPVTSPATSPVAGSEGFFSLTEEAQQSMDKLVGAAGLHGLFFCVR